MSRDLARAISAVERGQPVAVDRNLRPHLVAGITGPPGAGKSTLIDALLPLVEGRVAVIAVDPTSPYTGGALLGDRVRMTNARPEVFIRSMASHGETGGLAPRMEDVLALLAMHGYQTVLLETVGVGQEQIDVARVANVTAAVLSPASGDSVQAEKAGLLEAADLILLNKADLDGSDRAERELHEATGLPVIRTVAKTGEGAAAAWQAILAAAGRAKRPPQAGFSIDHLGIAVPSIAEALRFYESDLRMRVTHTETVDAERVHVAMLDAGQSRLELLEAAAADSTIAKFIEKRGPGLHHIALRVPDFEGAIATLRDSGARLIGEPRIGAGGHRYVFVHPASTGGVLLELIANEHS